MAKSVVQCLTVFRINKVFSKYGQGDPYKNLLFLKAGITAADDTLPERLLKDPIKTGPSKGHVSQLDKMLPEYYKLRGWDENGVPSKEKLKELSLKP